MEKDMAKVLSRNQMDTIIKDNFKMIKKVVLVNKNYKKVYIIKDNIKMIIGMDGV